MTWTRPLLGCEGTPNYILAYKGNPKLSSTVLRLLKLNQSVFCHYWNMWEDLNFFCLCWGTRETRIMFHHTKESPDSLFLMVCKGEECWWGEHINGMGRECGSRWRYERMKDVENGDEGTFLTWGSNDDRKYMSWKRNTIERRKMIIPHPIWSVM
jgi:hypothetical protein